MLQIILQQLQSSMRNDDKMISISLYIFVPICAVALVLLYISFVQYKRAEKALQAANVLIYNMGQIRDYITEASATLANPQLRAAFEADDEVGTFFKQITSIQEVLDQVIPRNEETGTELE